MWRWIGVLGLVGCSEAVVAEVPPPAVECTHAKALLATSSPFHSALTQWVSAPAGSKSALDALDFACDASEHVSCTLLGLIYSAGEGVKKDPTRAFVYFNRARGCGTFNFSANDLAHSEEHELYAGSAWCCGGIGCDRGCEAECARATDKVKSEVVPLSTKACDAGRGTACVMLSDLHGSGQYLQHIGSVSIGSDGQRLVERACTLGVGPACDRLEKFDAACAAGWADGCLSTGQKIEETKSRADAMKYYERACALGQHRVCNQIGDMFSLGEGVEVDHERAVKNYANAWR